MEMLYLHIILSRQMKLDVLICTCDKGIERIPAMLLPPRDDVSYVVSMQYTDESWLQRVPGSLRDRKDVSLHFLPGRGLSRNRNNALAFADGDVALIADDDCRYRPSYFDTVLRIYTEHPEVDMAQLRIEPLDAAPVKPYAAYAHPYEKRPRGMYPTSPELTLRVAAVKGKLFFNELFGLGSECLPCGEEDVFLHDAVQVGLSVWYFPYVVANVPGDSTGQRVYTDRRVMMAQGAVNYYVHGWGAWPRMLKFAAVGALKRKGNFFVLLSAACSGILYYKKKISHEDSLDRRCQ